MTLPMKYLRGISGAINGFGKSGGCLTDTSKKLKQYNSTERFTPALVQLKITLSGITVTGRRRRGLRIRKPTMRQNFGRLRA